MAVAALVGMDRHRGIGWMAADTEGGVEDVAQGGVVDVVGMGGRGLLVVMAVEAVYRGVVGVFDDILHCF